MLYASLISLSLLISSAVAGFTSETGGHEVGTTCNVTQEALDQATEEAGTYEIQVDEYCDL